MTDVATVTLAEFLKARFAETIATARHVQAQAVTEGLQVDDPRAAELRLAAYVLAEVEAKRRIVESIKYDFERQTDGWVAAQWLLRLLALPYSDHEAYREEWRP